MKWKWKWHTAKYGDPYSEFVLYILPIQVHTHTQQGTYKHREHTPRAGDSHLCCGARGAVEGSVPCSRAPQSWYRGWRESAVHSLTPSPLTIPAGPRLEVTTFRLWVRLSNISRELISINTTSPRNRGWRLATRTFSSLHRFSMGFWRLARPLQDLNMLLLEPLLCCLGCVFWVIVTLEYPSTIHFQYPCWFQCHGPDGPSSLWCSAIVLSH